MQPQDEQHERLSQAVSVYSTSTGWIHRPDRPLSQKEIEGENKFTMNVAEIFEGGSKESLAASIEIGGDWRRVFAGKLLNFQNFISCKGRLTASFVTYGTFLQLPLYGIALSLLD